jgi:hypothetical protein
LRVKGKLLMARARLAALPNQHVGNYNRRLLK